MSKQPKTSFFLSATLLFGTVVAFTGCEAEKGPVEKAGAAVDKGVRDAKNAITPAGPAEKAGRAVDDAVKPK
jgi:hypothetical protein